MDKMMITIKEACDITGLTRSCIRKLIFGNKIRFIKSGTRYYINRASLFAYCEGGETSDEG